MNKLSTVLSGIVFNSTLNPFPQTWDVAIYRRIISFKTTIVEGEETIQSVIDYKRIRIITLEQKNGFINEIYIYLLFS